MANHQRNVQEGEVRAHTGKPQRNAQDGEGRVYSVGREKTYIRSESTDKLWFTVREACKGTLSL